jgi:hypothetical protein
MSALSLGKEVEPSDKPPPSDGTAPLEGLADEPAPAAFPASAEVAIHELGESLAATVASVQGEMARYNTALGAYVLDEVDVSIPVLLRVTKLGQVLARVTDSQAPDAAVGQIRLRLKPSAGAAPVPTPPGAAQPLALIDLISREALAREVFGFDLQGVLDRAALVALPLPEGVGVLLIKLNVISPEQFVKSDPAQLADAITRLAGANVKASDVTQWQEASAAYMGALPLYK